MARSNRRKPHVKLDQKTVLRGEAKAVDKARPARGADGRFKAKPKRDSLGRFVAVPKRNGGSVRRGNSDKVDRTSGKRSGNAGTGTRGNGRKVVSRYRGAQSPSEYVRALRGDHAASLAQYSPEDFTRVFKTRPPLTKRQRRRVKKELDKLKEYEIDRDEFFDIMQDLDINPYDALAYY